MQRCNGLAAGRFSRAAIQQSDASPPISSSLSISDDAIRRRCGDSDGKQEAIRTGISGTPIL